MAISAHVLSLNDFGMPKVCNSIESAYTNLVYLIMLEKGKFQSHPDMGCSIRSRYRHNNDANFLQNLQRDITSQIEQYLPELSMIEVAVNNKNGVLGIIINTEQGSYAISYNSTNGIIDAPATRLLEDL
jgi:hypothetical protein